MQLAPMIDMTFLLLIFFMVTTKITKEQRKMDIKLPIASAAKTAEDLSNRELINIDERGDYFGGTGMTQTKMTPKEVEAYLKKRLQEHPPLRVYVRADAKTEAAKIRELMRMCAKAGAIEVIFGTTKK
jgi:biopolymer transport protein ExbD